MDHFITVGSILYLKTDPKPGIGPDLFIHNTARLLCRKNHMNTKASADSRHTDKIFHYLRLFLFQFRKLIHNNQQ